MSEDGFEIGPVPVPPGIVAQLRAEHDRAHMLYEDKIAGVHRLLDALNPEQLMALRFMLDTPPERCYGFNQYFDGMIVTLLRVVHKVNPDTGLDPAAELLASAQHDAQQLPEDFPGRGEHPQE